MDLNEDCQLHIIEQLPLSALISLAETNKQLSYLVVDVFRRKFGKTKMGFRTLFLDAPVIYNQTEGPIQIQAYETVLKVLSYFGPAIENLKIQYYGSDDKTHSIINQLMNSQCSNTLEELDMDSGKSVFFEDFTKPFKNLKNITVSGEFEWFGSEHFCFNEIFPTVSRLSLELVKIYDMSCFDREMPNLKHLEISFCIYYAPGCFRDEDIEKFLKKNQQIRKLKLSYLTRNMLKIIANELPNLESFQIEGYNEDDRDATASEVNSKIHFDKLKSFSIKTSSKSLPSNLSFAKLIEFQTDTNPRGCSKWIEFVEKNKYLKKYEVLGHFLENREVLRLAEANLNLVEAIIRCESDVEFETIAKFIKNTKQLEKLQLTFVYSVQKESLDKMFELLRERFNDQWMINKIENLGDITFLRKNSEQKN